MSLEPTIRYVAETNVKKPKIVANEAGDQGEREGRYLAAGPLQSTHAANST